MTLQQFLNSVRVLWNIDKDDYLACINPEDREFFGDDELWTIFRENPHRAFVALPDPDQRRVFAIIEQRNKAAGLS